MARWRADRWSGRTISKKKKMEKKNDFGDAAAVFLAEKLRGNTIVERLLLEECVIGVVGARALAETLGEQNNALKMLNLFANPSVGDDGVEAMALMLINNTTLEQLWLGECGVGGRGARALGEALLLHELVRIAQLLEPDIQIGANLLDGSE